MKGFWVGLLASCLLVTSCTKEEYIEFIPSDKDTIQWVYSHDPSGTYSGTIVNILWSGSTPVPISADQLTVTVSSLTYNKFTFENITNIVHSNADVDAFRFDDKVYFYFNPGSMSEGLFPDTVFSPFGQSHYNGRFDADSSYLEYFILDTNDQVRYQRFQGFRDE